MTTVATPPGAPPRLDAIRIEPTPARARRSTPRWSRWCHAHAIGIALSGAASTVGLALFFCWFRTGRYYARGDLPPFARGSTRAELTSVWAHQNTGAGGPAYPVMRAIELAFIDFAHALGGTNALAERFLFTAVFAFAATGLAALAARLVPRPSLVFAAGVLGAFNPLVMVSLPNFFLPIAIGLVGWFTALALDAAGGVRPARPRLFAVLSLLVSYIAINPPLVYVLVAWLSVLPIVAAALTGGGRRAAGRVVRLYMRALLWAVPLALWWVVPYLLALRAAAVGGVIAANTNAASWSWTHAHGSLDRVLTLVTNWSWPDLRFGSKASVFAEGQWRWLTFVLPLGVFGAPLLVRPERRRAALWMLVGVCVLALVGKGMNAPLGGLNALVYAHVPGMWLLREPMNKAGAMLVPGIVLGWAFSIDALVTRMRRRDARQRRRRQLLQPAICLMLAAPLLYAWPMLSGTVISGDRVRVPAAWHDVARLVNGSSLPGKALVLPLDDYYQQPTTWGFYGADTLVSQLVTRPTIGTNQQPYIGSQTTFDSLVEAAQRAVVARDTSAIGATFRTLNASHIIVRKDIDRHSPIRSVSPPTVRSLEAGLERVPGLVRVQTTSVADVYEYAAASATISTATGLVDGPRDSSGVADLVASTPPGLAVATGNGASDASSPAGASAVAMTTAARYVDAAGASFSPGISGSWTYQRHTPDAPLVGLDATDDSLTMRDVTQISVDGRRLAARPDASFAMRGKPVAVELDGAFVDLGAGESYARVAPGAQLVPYTVARANLVQPAPKLGDCDHYDDRSRAAAGLDATDVTAGDLHALRLAARAHSSCAAYSVAAVTGGDVVKVDYEQRAVQGAAPRSCLWQVGPDRCAALALHAVRDGAWFHMSALYRVPPGVSRVLLYVYADQPPAGMPLTEAWYRDLSVAQLAAAPVVTAPPAGTNSGTVALPARDVQVTSSVAAPVPSLGGAWKLGDCHRDGNRTLADAGISSRALGAPNTDAVRLAATADAACVSRPITAMEPAVTYDVSIDARQVRGSAPRMCVWEPARSQCAKFSSIAVPKGGDGEYVYRGRLDADGGLPALFLYADGVKGGTVVDYRGVRIRPVADDSLVFAPVAARPAVAPAMTWHEDSPSHYRVAVRGASGPFVLALSETYAGGWTLTGLPAGAHVTHVQLDGYRNGWIITANGDFDLSIAYQPARWGRLAITASELAALVLLMSVVFGFVMPRRRRRRVKVRARRPAPKASAGTRRVPLPDDWLLPSQ